MSDVASAIAKIQEDRHALAAAQAAAAAGEEERNSTLAAAKAHCDEVCGEVQAARAAATDPAEIAALVELETRVHAEHKDALEAAYLVFAGQRNGDSNPAEPGDVTPLEAEIAVSSETGA